MTPWQLRPGMSAAVRTARTSGMRGAPAGDVAEAEAGVVMGLRTSRTASVPAGQPSAPKASVPSTLGSPSSRSSRAPTAPSGAGASAPRSPSPPPRSWHSRCSGRGRPRSPPPPRPASAAGARATAPRPRSASPACRCRIAPRRGAGRRAAAAPAAPGRGQRPRPSRPSGPRRGRRASGRRRPGAPSTSTVQAPQSPASQPTFTPSQPKASRSAALSRAAGATSACRAGPVEGERQGDPPPRAPAGSASIRFMPPPPSEAARERPAHEDRHRVVPIGGLGPHVADGREPLDQLRAHRRGEVRRARADQRRLERRQPPRDRAQEPTATAARAMRPCASCSTCAATMAMEITRYRRAPSLTKADRPERRQVQRHDHLGGASATRRTPVTKASSGTRRVPPAPRSPPRRRAPSAPRCRPPRARRCRRCRRPWPRSGSGASRPRAPLPASARYAGPRSARCTSVQVASAPIRSPGPGRDVPQRGQRGDVQRSARSTASPRAG
jgi:hypothetical protein